MVNNLNRPSKSGIYAIINEANGKIYIGSSVNIKKRTKDHLVYLKNGNHTNEHLQRAFNKYGKESFRFAVLELCSVKKLKEREQFFINKYNSSNEFCGYNLMIRADRMFITEEMRIKMSNSHKGQDPWNKGKKGIYSEETLKKISESGKGRTPWNKGKSFSLESRKKMSESQKQSPKNKELIKKLAETNKGRCLTEEHKNSIRMAHLGKPKNPESIKKALITKKLKKEAIKCRQV